MGQKAAPTVWVLQGHTLQPTDHAIGPYCRIKIAMFPLEASTASARDSLHFPTNGQHSISPADSVPLYQEHFLCMNPQEEKQKTSYFKNDHKCHRQLHSRRTQLQSMLSAYSSISIDNILFNLELYNNSIRYGTGPIINIYI